MGRFLRENLLWVALPVILAVAVLSWFLFGEPDPQEPAPAAPFTYDLN